MSYRHCDRCGSDAFLTSGWNSDDEPIWLCQDCIDSLRRASAPPPSAAIRSTLGGQE